MRLFAPLALLVIGTSKETVHGEAKLSQSTADFLAANSHQQHPSRANRSLPADELVEQKKQDSHHNSATNNIEPSMRYLQSEPVQLQLQMIDASTGQVVVDRLENGMTVSLASLGLPESPSLNIVAVDSSDTVGAVRFSNGRYEGGKPFTYCGDIGAGREFNTCDDLKMLGTHEITATAIQGGAQVGTTAVTFTIVSEDPASGGEEASLAFRLVHVPTKQVVADLQQGTVVDLQELGIDNPSFSIEAVTSEQVEAVKFSSGHREGAAPFYYCGDRSAGTEIFACDDLVVGSHTISAIVFGNGGTRLGSYTVSFEILMSGEEPEAPVVAPVPSPVADPIPEPTYPPVAKPTPSIDPILVNVGGGYWTDLYSRKWEADFAYALGGKTNSEVHQISGTEDDFLYLSERYGSFRYEFEVPVGDYEVVLHFAENFYSAEGMRVFDIRMQNQTAFQNVDILKLTNGLQFQAVTLESTQIVSDGILTIELVKLGSSSGDPKLCGIEINVIGPHLAHAVVGGPYTAVAPSNGDGSDGVATVSVDGHASHTHGPGLRLVEWIWKVNNAVVGTGEETQILLPPGVHTLSLFVKDDDGNESAESTSVTVLTSEYPAVQSISPTSGDVGGGDFITIKGSGFTFAESATVVHFGGSSLSSTDISIVDSNTITLSSPIAAVATTYYVAVSTPLGKSNSVAFTYIDVSPIAFTQKKVIDIYSPTTVAFGPDEKLYVGTADGWLYKLTLDDNFNVVDTMSSSILHDQSTNKLRTILGIAFDPMETSDIPGVYITHTYSFHGESASSSGGAINGKVSIVSGSNLDQIRDVVTGLPASDHDHAVNGIEFGDHGELYIQVGGNTNAGVPGRLSASRIQKENVMGASTLVAYLSDPYFDGNIEYDAADDGNMISGSGVEVFAFGNRNPYDLVLHSNGYLYGSDNGPNVNYGDRSTGCTPGQELPEIEEEDKINLLEYNRYYGHPNRKRGQTDPRQCIWHSANDPSDDDYTAPIVVGTSAIVGICEFQTNHFNGQMRGNLIYSKYKDPLHRVILTADGRGVIPQSNPPTELVGDHTLDVTQAPDGSLVDTRYLTGAIFAYTPSEAATSALVVKGVFPRRGSVAGGSTLKIYGVNFDKATITSVSVGGSACPVVSVSSNKIVCTLPGGSGTVDVVVSTASESSTFERGYRYITGLPE